jgi:hypothetical protein
VINTPHQLFFGKISHIGKEKNLGKKQEGILAT